MANNGQNILSRAHFQLTRNCNLNCVFCGQRKGALDAKNENLPFAGWLHAAHAVKNSAQEAGREPRITLWGGEPLLYPHFSKLAQAIHRIGCRQEVVSNGTLIDYAATALNEFFDTVYVSFDGFGADDDAIRGEGTFARVTDNLALLRERRGKLVFLLTLSEINVRHLPNMLENFSGLQPDGIIIQPLIYLSQAEIDAYREYSRSFFGCDYPGLQSYCAGNQEAYEAELQKQIESIDFDAYNYEVCFTPHTHNKPCPPCAMVNERVHISCDGEVGFCTDFFGYSAGNILNDPLEKIFSNRRSEKFRKAVNESKLTICEHCPWRSHNDCKFSE